MHAQTCHYLAENKLLCCAGFVVIGFIAAISLLLRHWGAIEKYHLVAPLGDITTPLLQVCSLIASFGHP